MYDNLGGLLYISIGLTVSSFVGWWLYQYYLKCRSMKNSIKNSKRLYDSINARPDPQSTTRVYFDSLSGINETRSYFVNSSEIDDINLNPNDNHNVHNVSIINAIKKRLPILYENNHQRQQKYTFVQVIQQLKDSLSKDCLDKRTEYPYVSKVLRFILESRASYSSKKIKELIYIKIPLLYKD